jgi:hypothetical protein
MPLRRTGILVPILCLISLGLASCAIQRSMKRLGGNATQPLETTDKATLAAIVARNYNLVRDFNATVDMTPVLGSAEKNKITEYKDLRAFILFRRPADIRILGLVPMIRNTAFDMVSDGVDFKLHIPSKNLFVVGNNEIVKPSENKLENLRPQHLLDALLVRPLTNPERILMENFTDEEDAFYILNEVQEGSGGQLLLKRAVWFNRLNLAIARQLIFDDAGDILSDARYDGWRYYDNAPFAKHIEINRPQDEYGVVIDVVKMDINKGVAAEKFVLNQPDGTTLRVVGQAPAPAPSQSPPPRKRT